MPIPIPSVAIGEGYQLLTNALVQYGQMTIRCESQVKLNTLFQIRIRKLLTDVHLTRLNRSNPSIKPIR